MKLSGRTVLLTGATGGIGHAIARTMTAQGARLVLTGRRIEVLEAIAAELGAERVAADLCDPAAVRALIDTHGDADVLVANAALPASGRLWTFSEDEIDRALDVNLRAPIVLAHALVERMRARGSGHVVFINSLSGKAATQGQPMYNATKFGLRGFAGGLRADLHGTGVGVSAVFPGFVSDAGMFADAEVQLPRGVGTRTPEQVARAVVRAIEHDKGEVDVAPLSLRLGATLASLAPDLATRINRRMGGDDVAAGMEAGQASKR
ncbi:MAG: SDR family NAD(P)-dependent oxidoreductase [Solirubrobacterales bacterium]|nr:SDR family NAD(P)-dependent oxidoreductase [Solirubrobacterales bacterium]